jgi:hypothetical protein
MASFRRYPIRFDFFYTDDSHRQPLSSYSNLLVYSIQLLLDYILHYFIHTHQAQDSTVQHFASRQLDTSHRIAHLDQLSFIGFTAQIAKTDASHYLLLGRPYSARMLLHGSIDEHALIAGLCPSR